jgi:glutamate racemase
VREIQKINSHDEVYQQPAPLLVPLIENDGIKWAEPIVEEYLAPLRQKDVDTIILGCTHYPFLKDLIREKSGNTVTIISQDEVVPFKLKGYLERHPEIESKLSRRSNYTFEVTDLTETTQLLANKLFERSIDLHHVRLT